MSKARGLGRGFDSLIPNHVEPEFDPAPVDESGIAELDVESIDPNPNQPRDSFDPQELDALSASIKEHGVLQPVVVRKVDQRYELIAGERRLRAVKSLKLKTIPAIVRSFDEQQSLELALIENIQREQLNPVETAAAYEKLISQFNLAIKEVAKRVGRDQSTIKNTLRLLKLPTEAKRALADNTITEGHARSILSLGDQSDQMELLKQITSHGWTVRQAEEFARDTKTNRPSPTQVTGENSSTKELSKALDTKVQVQRRAKGGRLMIHYEDDDDLERIVGKLL